MSIDVYSAPSVGIAVLFDLLLQLSTLAPLVAQLGTREFLQLSGDIQNVDGFPQWQFTDLARKAGISLMPVTLAIVWVLVTLFVGFGARVCGWILFLLGPAAFSCLLTVLGYGYHTLNNSHSVTYLKQMYNFSDSDSNVLMVGRVLIHFIMGEVPGCDIYTLSVVHLCPQNWLEGFRLLVYTFPMWTAICCTMGKLCGRSQRIRNLTWIPLVVVFLLVSQLPNLAMAPYLGNLQSSPHQDIVPDLGRIMWQMPAAFTSLKIPHAYGFVFYLSAFLFTLMFLCVGTLTIVDNIVDSLKHWIDKHTCSKIAVHLLITFLVMLVGLGLGIIQTTKGLWLYHLYYQLDIHSTNVKLDKIISLESDKYLAQEWTWVSWAIAGFPFTGILLGAIHACFSACKDPTRRCRKLCCGVTERVREQNGDDFAPPPHLPSEPSAPPYMYSYIDRSMNGSHRHEDYDLDHYKLDYDSPETEPLTRGNRSTRI
ncbi:hypothetical protein Btru_043965 [Bulinus truncatus]|nr:hypothetical protein Btru_043965 [Bulinus truncatus]